MSFGTLKREFRTRLRETLFGGGNAHVLRDTETTYRSAHIRRASRGGNAHVLRDTETLLILIRPPIAPTVLRRGSNVRITRDGVDYRG